MKRTPHVPKRSVPPTDGSRRPTRIDPRDTRQLEESPVSLKRVVALFAPFRARLFVVTLTIIAAAIVGLGQPFLVRAIIDDALPAGNTKLLIWCVVGLVAAAAITGALGVVQTWLSTQIGQSVMHRLRTDVFTQLQRQSLDFFTRVRSGEVHSRLTNDVAGLQSVVTTTATSVASNLTTAVATAVAMVALNWRLALLSLVILPPAIWSTRRVALLRKDLTAQRQRAMAELHGSVEESLSVSGALLGKTLGLEQRREEQFAAKSWELVGLELSSQLAGRWRMATMQLMFAVTPALVYLAAGFPQASGGLTIGTLIAFTTLQVSIFRPILGLLNIGAQWVASMALLSRIFGYLDLTNELPEASDPVEVDPTEIRGELRFEGVSFRYPDATRDVLHDVNLVVPPGTSVGIVGETGSGKSTLASLALRLADPSVGRILLDGHDLSHLSPTTLHSLVGVVTQETYLIHDSIRANLLLARPDASEAELWTALETAHIAEQVASLPEGLDTVVGARGHRFSGGERQRLAIARTLLRDPRILILDEATSALDNETEREVQEALDELAIGRTTLTIAHRLSTVAKADEVIVLDEGRIVERGGHDELVALGGRYAELAA